MGKQTLKLDRHGGHAPREMDHTPLEMPVGHRVPTPLATLIANSVRLAVQNELGTENEVETMEEADDFTEDEPNTIDLSPYELDELHEEGVASMTLETPQPDDTPELEPTPEQPEADTDPPVEPPSE